MEHFRWLWAALLAAIGLLAGEARAAAHAEADLDVRARRVIATYESTIRPLEVQAARCWWAANVSGKADDFRKQQQSELQIGVCLARSHSFVELKALFEARPSDPLLARQIDVLYRQYLGTQLEPPVIDELLATTNAVEQAFNVYRPRIGGRKTTSNEVRRVLRQSTDSDERRAAWEAALGVGRAVETELRRLIHQRNEVARRLGFANYYALQLFLGEQDRGDVERLFDTLETLTRQPYRAAKAEIDTALAARCHVAVDQLRPWHYHDPFAQVAPAVFPDAAESVYGSLDIVRLCRDFYGGIGLPVDDLLRRSDLYEKQGKSPHAFCADLDRAGDVRILVNIAPGKQWLTTTLHELGHAVYSSKNIPPHMPYALRTEAHSLVTEGVAMMFERLAGNPDWLAAMGVRIGDLPRFRAAAAWQRRVQLLMFARFCQVMFRFETALYENPDQDLNRLWWELVEKYQEIRRPEGRNEPDYAAKLHIITSPGYFHNYLLGALFASQLHRTLVRQFFAGDDPARVVYVGRKDVGRFLQERVFAAGRTMPWNELIRAATGELLSVRAFAEDIGAAWGGDAKGRIAEATPSVAPLAHGP
jgi:peptidyl-dipeptidase A